MSQETNEHKHECLHKAHNHLILVLLYYADLFPNMPPDLPFLFSDRRRIRLYSPKSFFHGFFTLLFVVLQRLILHLKFAILSTSYGQVCHTKHISWRPGFHSKTYSSFYRITKAAASFIFNLHTMVKTNTKRFMRGFYVNFCLTGHDCEVINSARANAHSPKVFLSQGMKLPVIKFPVIKKTAASIEMGYGCFF